MKNLIIIGAGSVGGHLATNLAAYSGEYQLLGFLDDKEEKIGASFCGYPVLGPVSDVSNYQSAAVFIGIAFPRIKHKVYQRIRQNDGLEFPSFISPRAWVSPDIKIGDGTIIYPGCSINYGSKIGRFIVMNMNCAIGHDSRLNDFCSLAPGVNLGGHTHLASGVDMGIGAATKQSVRIGANTVVGGQSMVIADVEKDLVIAGVPAKTLRAL